MQQRWWLVGVAGVGIVLALLLVPRPDTGNDLPPPVDADVEVPDVVPGAATPSPTPSPQPPRATRGDQATPRPSPDQMKAPSPAAQEHWEKRNAPDPTAARTMASPWGAIRREMVLADTDEGASLIAKIAPVQADMVAFGNLRDDGNGNLSSLVSQMDSVASDVKSSSFISNPTVAAAIGRYESARDQWQAAQ